MKIPLIKPYITEEIKARVCDVLDSGYLTEGPVTRQFEDSVKSYIGCKFALAVCNCTVGLELALRALGVGPGDEVIVPDYTYPASATVVNIVGATIVLVDIDPHTMLIDYAKVEKAVTERTKAIIAVSIFGNPLDYKRLDEIKEKYGLYLIEDAACSIGATYNDIPVGNLADISVFSFHPRKFITTGEGGMVVTNNAQWAEWMASYKQFGMTPSESRQGIRFERIGTNYKLSNIQAAIGLVQMQHISDLLETRAQSAAKYQNLLSEKPHVAIPKVTPNGIHAWQSFCIFVPDRDQILNCLRSKDIEAQIGTYALHMHDAFANSAGCRISGDVSQSRYVFDHCLTLPLYHDMTDETQQYVVDKLLNCIG